MKTIVMLGLLSLLLSVAYVRGAGTPNAAAQSPVRSVATAAAAELDGELPTRLSEYVFLHQARYEGIPVHAMAGVKTCPE